MDLQYLLYLQENVRNETLNPFMMEISNIAIGFWLLAVFMCLYWCVNKKSGLFILASYSISSLVNAVVKLSFCIYRPWIRDPNITPPQIPFGAKIIDAKRSASGYSFPSGHTQVVTSYFVSCAYLAWKKYKWLSILCLLAIFIVAFSRNYLGVHTPQDVIVGFILGSLSVFWGYNFINRTNQDKKSDTRLLIYAILIGIASILYFTFKNYPTELDEAGKLIVDPKDMMKDGFLGIGIWFGFNLGWYIEKYYVDFSTECSLVTKIIRAIIGIATTYLVYHQVSSLFYENMPKFCARMCQWTSMMLYIIAIYPLIFKFIERLFFKNNQKETKGDLKCLEQ